MNKLILFLTIGLFFASCSNEESLVPTTKGQKTITLELDIQVPQEIVTRTVFDKRIYNIVIFTFDAQGMLLVKRSSFSNSPADNASLTVDDVSIVQGSTLYAIANIGNNTSTSVSAFEKAFLGITDETSLLHLIETTKINTDIPVTTVGTGTGTQGLIMVGKMSFPDLISDRVVIPLRRTTARINTCTINVATGVDTDFRLVGARIACMPDACYLIPRDVNQDGKDDDILLDDNEYITSDWFAPVLTGTLPNRKITISNFYLLENHKGNGPDKSNLSIGDVTPKNASFLEILASYKGSEYTYRVYLGSDNAKNYDVERNTDYTITVDINGLNQIDTDIRISRFFNPQENDWYLTDGLLLHYDGIKNNGDSVRVTNSTTAVIADPQRPATSGSTATNFYYNYSNLPGGVYVPVLTSSPETDGKKNRWKNIAPATIGKYNIPIYSTSNSNTTAQNAWGPDCFASPNGTIIASMEICDSILFPEIFTIECVFMSSEGNTASGGNDLFAFWYAPTGPRYVIADVETYQNGLGLIAGTNWNGLNYGTNLLTGRKHRVVIQFDGQKLIAWLGNKVVYTEPKATTGPIPWRRGPLGSPGPNGPAATRAEYATQLNLGTWVRHNTQETFRGNIYSFRYYNRMLTKSELDYNFSMDIKRFGVVNLIN